MEKEEWETKKLQTFTSWHLDSLRITIEISIY